MAIEIVDFPIKMVIFHSYVTVYRRVNRRTKCAIYNGYVTNYQRVSVLLISMGIYILWIHPVLGSAVSLACCMYLNRCTLYRRRLELIGKSFRIGSGAVTQFHWDLKGSQSALHCILQAFRAWAATSVSRTDGIPDSALRAEGIQIPGDKVRSSSLRWKSKWFLWVGIQVNGQVPLNRQGRTLEARQSSSWRPDWRSPEGGHGDGPWRAEQRDSRPYLGY